MINNKICILEKGVAGPCETICKEGSASFRMIGFTDTHVDDWADRAACTLEAMEKAIRREQPDLVLLLGDNVTGGDNRARLEAFCNLMDDLGVYWCPILGNHEGDNPRSVTRAFMVQRMAQSKYCLMESEDKYLADGTVVAREGNYALHLADNEGKIFETLFFINTGSDMSDEEKLVKGFEVEKTVYDYILPSQIQWYKEILKAQGEGIPSVMFGHIPLYEYKESYELATANDTCYEVDKEVGPGCSYQYGYRREGICSSRYNSGMFQAILEGGSTHAYLCGHDHINDFIVRYKGITLGYNTPGSYSSYNVISKRDKINVGKTDKLIQGYSIYIFEKGKELKIKPVHYHDIFPEMREKVWNVIRK